ncbi:endonuclease/exonuclease/phosphatase family protein [Streptomyces sp900129855]|uniref:Endonuclease/exonuclease/phosphatase family protein n=1 Tax=Streptomyces sp. 900129855 TaxID=3155129 RepID=A0ABV2ZLG3_9ACTN
MSVAAAPAHASPSTHTFEIGTFNMAGGNGDYFGEDGDYDSEDAVSALAASIKDRSPAFVTVQESCSAWLSDLDSRLDGYSYAFSAVVSGGGSTASCKEDGAGEFGNAVIFKDGLGFDAGAAVGHSLGSPAGEEQREMLCVPSAFLSTVACSAHLSVNSASARETELGNALDILNDAYGSYTHFLGGDFNATPLSDELDQIYHEDYGWGAEGKYQEVDSRCGEDMSYPLGANCRTGESTHGPWFWREKIDYIFVSADPVTVDWADVTSAKYSDHDPLWASVTY